MNEQELIEKLRKYPELKARFADLVRIIENPIGETDLADVAEEHVIVSLRNLGRDTLQEWAHERSEQASERLKKQVKSAHKNIKKKCTGKRASGK